MTRTFDSTRSRRLTGRAPFLCLAAATAAWLAAASAPTQAQRTLTIAAGGVHTTLDPHATSSLANNATRQQLYDALVESDARGVLRPRLAEAWRTLDDRTWVAGRASSSPSVSSSTSETTSAHASWSLRTGFARLRRRSSTLWGETTSIS